MKALFIELTFTSGQKIISDKNQYFKKKKTMKKMRTNHKLLVNMQCY